MRPSVLSICEYLREMYFFSLIYTDFVFLS
jgi:hypothetical protein